MLGWIISRWNWVKGKKRVFRRFAFELFVPTIAGLGWGFWAAYKGAEPYAALSLGAAALFFVLSMQGQILRMNKNVKDEENAQEWRAQFVSLHDGLAQLRSQDEAAKDVVLPPAPVHSDEPMLGEARRVLEEGFYFPAAVTAAVAFEQALRQAAPKIDIPSTGALAAVARRFASVVGDKMLEERLLTLVRLRNSLVHRGDAPSLFQGDSAELIKAFSQGIDAIAAITAKYESPIWPSSIFKNTDGPLINPRR